MKDYEVSMYNVKSMHDEATLFSMVGKEYLPGRNILSPELLPCAYAPEREEKSFSGKITERWKKIKGKLKDIKPL